MFSSWWITDYLQERGPVFVLSVIVWVIGSIVLHELAHGWMAIKCGDDTPIETGHMTVNPVVHMGVVGLVLFALVGFAFGQMPVNPRRFRGRYDDAKVAFAGPEMNFTLAVGATVALVLFDHFGRNASFYGNLHTSLEYGARLNFALGFLNLIPVMPLDGSTVLARFSTYYRDTFTGPQARSMSQMLLIVIFIFGSSRVFAFSARVVMALRNGVADLLF